MNLSTTPSWVALAMGMALATAACDGETDAHSGSSPDSAGSAAAGAEAAVPDKVTTKNEESVAEVAAKSVSAVEMRAKRKPVKGAAQAEPVSDAEAFFSRERFALAGQSGSSNLQVKIEPVEIGAEGDSAQGPSASAGASPLAAADAQALFKGLDPPPKAGRPEFQMPPTTKAPPIAGNTVEVGFEPDDSAGAPDAGVVSPLEVRRHAPDGSVNDAGRVTVVFSQAMVPLTSLDQLARQVPATLEPQAAGQWRWLDTSTLVFNPDGPLPKATRYRVRVPAGTKSRLGGSLEKDYEFEFQLPPPTIRSMSPSSGTLHLRPAFVVVFDQAIDPSSVMAHTVLTAGSKNAPVELIAESEWNGELSWIRDRLGPDKVRRGVAFRPVRDLPRDTDISLVFTPGIASAEGPLLTTESEVRTYRTFSPLAFQKIECGWRDSCQPGQRIRLEFNNEIDREKLDETWVTVSPAIDEMKVTPSYRGLDIQGATKGNTKYTVSVSADVRDVYDQKLGQTVTKTVRVKPAEPRFWLPKEWLTTLSPDSPVLPVYGMNQKPVTVSIWRVEPSDYADAVTMVRGFRGQTVDKWDRPSVWTGQLEFPKRSGEISEARLDLRPALGDQKTGQLLVRIAPRRGLLAAFGDDDWRRKVAHVWVQVTDLGVIGHDDASELTAWVTELSSGDAVKGATVTTVPLGTSGRTDADGVTTVSLGAADDATPASLVVVEQGGDRAILPARNGVWGNHSWRRWERVPTGALYVFDDRQLYRPGETVRLKGFYRQLTPGPQGDVVLPKSVPSLEVKVTDATGNDMAEGVLKPTKLGGFDYEFALPRDAPLGNVSVRFSADEKGLSVNHRHSVRVEEFRRPEFEVGLDVDPGPHFTTGSTTAQGSAAYYSGGPLPSAKTTWRVETMETEYRPPNHERFSFGRYSPPWERWHGGRFHRPSHRRGVLRTETAEATTDIRGRAALKIDFVTNSNPMPTTVSTTMSVEDVNRQKWSTARSTLVHGSSAYVGLRTESSFIDSGEPLLVEAIAVGVEGEVLEGRPVDVVVWRNDWVFEDGNWQTKRADTQHCAFQSTAGGATACQFDAPKGGQYRIWARVDDAEGRFQWSERRIWVSGAAGRPHDGLEKLEARIIPDRESYARGDVAKLLIISPISPANGRLTVIRGGIATAIPFRLDGPTATIELPLRERWYPRVNLLVEIVGTLPHDYDLDDGSKLTVEQPAYATGSGRLDMDLDSERLAVKLTPAAPETEPGAKTTVNVEVTDPDGQAVRGAEVAVVMVDESVLALANYSLADPLGLFYRVRHDDTLKAYLHDTVLVGAPVELAPEPEPSPPPSPAPGGGMPKKSKMRMRSMADKDGEMKMELERSFEESADAPEEPAEAGEQAAIRKNFDALAVFAPEVVTDSKGRATVGVTLPDSTTRYRVFAVAGDSSGQRFGRGEAFVTARLPLTVRPSLPRFLRVGDKAELPVVVQNQSGASARVDVGLRGSIVGGPAAVGQRIEVASDDRAELRFPVEISEFGQGMVQVIASGAGHRDAAQIQLPVYAPLTTEAFATYGVLDSGGARLEVRAPAGAQPGYGGLEVTTSTTALQALTDAYIYLASYPYECSEQLSSKLLAIAALRDVLGAFDAPGLPAADEIESLVDKAVAKLVGLQHSDGGFGFWRPDSRAWPYLGVHVAYAFVKLRAKGYDVPDSAFEKSMGYLKNIRDKFPALYSVESQRMIEAYALYVRALAGDPDLERARALVSEAGLDKLGLDAVSWLLTVAAKAPAGAGAGDTATWVRHLENRAEETAAAAHFTTRYGDASHLVLHSKRRTDGIALEGLIAAAPDHDLIPKLVNGLLAHRKRGRWSNTQENAFILLALDRYFQAYESVEPDLLAKMWLGDSLVMRESFKGRSTDRKKVEIPLEFLTQRAAQGAMVSLTHSGAGRLYYRLGLRYAPQKFEVPALERGFSVSRQYQAVDDPSEVTKNADGTWTVKAGATVKVRVEMVAPSQRAHVALVDPLPAGLEPVNPELATTSPHMGDDEGEEDSGRRFRWWGPWYEHQGLRDERAEAFASWLPAGAYVYTYYARATTPGEFLAPPAKAEEMYSPETFGRSASDRVRVVQ